MGRCNCRRRGGLIVAQQGPVASTGAMEPATRFIGRGKLPAKGQEYEYGRTYAPMLDRLKDAAGPADARDPRRPATAPCSHRRRQGAQRIPVRGGGRETALARLDPEERAAHLPSREGARGDRAFAARPARDAHRGARTRGAPDRRDAWPRERAHHDDRVRRARFGRRGCESSGLGASRGRTEGRGRRRVGARLASVR